MAHSAFLFEDYYDIKGHLMAYRLDDKIIAAESKTGKNRGVIFTFARGLRFSALLIYKIRKILNGTNLTASWGQILNENGEFSNECDIIIHENGYEHYWNGEGGTEKIMDFKFIAQQKVRVVISCKSYLKTNTIEVDYLENIQNFAKRVWLFAECSPKQSIGTIRRNAIQIGYEKFWHLYGYDKKNRDITDAFDEWEDFAKTVRALADN